MNERSKKQEEIILSLLSKKSVMKQDVYSNTIAVFNEFKSVLKDRAETLSDEITKADKRINIFFKDVSLQSMQLKWPAISWISRCTPTSLNSIVRILCLRQVISATTK